MPYQLPKKNHPWRTWQGPRRLDKGLGPKKLSKKDLEKFLEKEREENLRTVKSFLADLISGWDKVEIYTDAYGKTGKYYLKELTQFKIAAWLAGVLKRNYGHTEG